jgi:hypothetical protein
MRDYILSLACTCSAICYAPNFTNRRIGRIKNVRFGNTDALLGIAAFLTWNPHAPGLLIKRENSKALPKTG